MLPRAITKWVHPRAGTDASRSRDRRRSASTSRAERQAAAPRFAVDGALDLEEDIDTPHGFAGNRRLRPSMGGIG